MTGGTSAEDGTEASVEGCEGAGGEEVANEKFGECRGVGRGTYEVPIQLAWLDSLNSDVIEGSTASGVRQKRMGFRLRQISYA